MALLLLVYPAVLVANSLRAVAMIEMSLTFGAARILNAPVHGLSGIGVFAFVLGLLWLCADREGLREAIA